MVFGNQLTMESLGTYVLSLVFSCNFFGRRYLETGFQSSEGSAPDRFLSPQGHGQRPMLTPRQNVTSFIWVGTYFADSSSVYTADIDGIAWVTFDSTSGTSGSATPRIFVGRIAIPYFDCG
jgi:hypothetical protein